MQSVGWEMTAHMQGGNAAYAEERKANVNGLNQLRTLHAIIPTNLQDTALLSLQTLSLHCFPYKRFFDSLDSEDKFMLTLAWPFPDTDRLSSSPCL